MRRGFNHNILCRRIDSSKLTGQSLDQIVDHLRSNYPDYTRLQRKPFSNNVKQALQMQQKRKQPASASNAEKHNDDEDIDTTTPIEIRTRKKSRQNDEREDQLCRRETEYVRRIRRVQNSPSPSTSGSSSSGETSGEEGESADSLTSEDAIFGAKVEPEVDLMKSMLRLQYSGNKSEFKFAEEKNLEVDVDNKAKKMDIVKVGGSKVKLKRESTDSKNTEGSETKGRDTCGVKGGPRFEDLGGIKGILDDLYMDVIAPLYHSQVSQWLGIKPLAGILLHGPPGCGKTKLAHAIANEAGVPFYKISATEVVSGVSGASEENIRDLFTKAYRTAPSIVFIDEIDAIASKRENLQREMEKRIVTQLLTCMDDSSQIKSSAEGDLGSEKPGYVLVIGATNRPDALDPALRRPGRFDREISLGIPDEKARAEILSVLVCKLRLESGGAFDIEKIARSTAGFVGADLEALVNKAGNLAMRRIFSSRKVNNEDWLKQPFSADEVETLAISMTDFEEAVKVVQPSLRREGFSTIPDVKWEDVGGLDDLRKEFDRYIVSRIKDPEDYEDFGVNMETGFLLYGPPGCGKTLIAKAVANEAGANFIHIKGPELLNKYVGESELSVRTIFRRARTCSPCIIFFDEVDAVTMKRGKEGAWVVERLFTQLLIELDGADQRRGVFVIGATNRPEVMDEAILRPGRLGKLMYVPLPDSNQRGLILKALARKKPICPDVDLIAIGQNEACENYSGADLAQVMNDAAIVALEEKRMLGEGSYIIKDWDIKKDHIDQALEKVVPSVSTQQRKEYDSLSTKLQGKGRSVKEPNACVDRSELLHLFESR